LHAAVSVHLWSALGAVRLLGYAHYISWLDDDSCSDLSEWLLNSMSAHKGHFKTLSSIEIKTRKISNSDNKEEKPGNVKCKIYAVEL